MNARCNFCPEFGKTHYLELSAVNVLAGGGMFKWIVLCPEHVRRMEELLFMMFGEFKYQNPSIGCQVMSKDEMAARNREIRDRETEFYVEADLLNPNDSVDMTVHEALKARRGWYGL